MESSSKTLSIDTEVLECPRCNGTGVAHIHRHLSSMYDSEDVPCYTCNESGKISRTVIKRYVVDVHDSPYEK